MVGILGKLDKFVLGAKYNFVFRILQITVIGAIMILEIVQFAYFNAFFVNRLNWSRSHYFSTEFQDVFGLKSYYTFVILFTWIDTALYIGLFYEFWSKENINKLNIISDLFFAVMWLSVGLTNIIPSYRFTKSMNCLDYNFYSTDEYSDYRDLCRAYVGSMSLSWVMFFLFCVASFASWRAYKRK